MKNKGFTLIELIVVIAIIAILAAIIAPNAFKAIEKSKIASTIEDCRSIKTATMSYYSDTGVWPLSSAAAGNAPAGLVITNAQAGWDGPYIEKWPPLARWSGGYSFVANTDSSGAANDPLSIGAFNWDGVAATPQVRLVSVSLVPNAAAQRMDVQLDGADDANAGALRTGASVTVGNRNVFNLISVE
jgi:general secretion pathway protein G